MGEDKRGKKTVVRKRLQKPRTVGRVRRTRRMTKKENAEKQIAASTSLAYLSKGDLRRHIHDGLKPYQHLADQAGLNFLSYLIAMAVEEADSGTIKKISDDEES